MAGNIVVNVLTNPSGSLQPFRFRPSWGVPFKLTDMQQNDSGAIPAGIYAIQQDGQGGWSTDIQVSSGDSPLTINLTDGATITVTFTETAQGSWFQLEKSVVCVRKDASIPVRGLST